MLLDSLLGARLAAVACFFLALAAWNPFAASGVLLDVAGGARRIRDFFFNLDVEVGLDVLAEGFGFEA